MNAKTVAQLRADLTSGDVGRILTAASDVMRLWDRAALQGLATHLPEIHAKTAGIELGGGLHPNAVHLHNAITRMEFARDQTGCLCSLNGLSQFTDPSQEAAAGRLRILETVMDGNYPDHYRCECLVCGTRYKVIERCYHYTWWGWEPDLNHLEG